MITAVKSRSSSEQRCRIVVYKEVLQPQLSTKTPPTLQSVYHNLSEVSTTRPLVAQLYSILRRSTTMSARLTGRVIRNMARGARTIPILVGEVVQDQGFIRVIDAIEPAVITESADRVENAFKGSAMLTESQKDDTDKIIITYVAAQSGDRKDCC